MSYYIRPANTTRFGLVPTASGAATDFLNGTGAFSAPGSGGPASSTAQGLVMLPGDAVVNPTRVYPFIPCTLMLQHAAVSAAIVGNYGGIGLTAMTNPMVGAAVGTRVSDNDGTWIRVTTALVAETGGCAAYVASANTFVRINRKFYWSTRIRSGASIANIRVWCGILGCGATNGSQFDNIAGGLTGNMAAFRYSAGVSANWFTYTSNGATETATDTGIAVAANTIYFLEIFTTAANTLTFRIGNGTIYNATVTTNLVTGADYLTGNAAQPTGGIIGSFMNGNVIGARTFDFAGHIFGEEV